MINYKLKYIEFNLNITKTTFRELCVHHPHVRNSVTHALRHVQYTGHSKPGGPPAWFKGSTCGDPTLFENDFCALFLFSSNFDDFMPFLRLQRYEVQHLVSETCFVVVIMVTLTTEAWCKQKFASLK